MGFLAVKPGSGVEGPRRARFVREKVRVRSRGRCGRRTRTRSEGDPRVSPRKRDGRGRRRVGTWGRREGLGGRGDGGSRPRDGSRRRGDGGLPQGNGSRCRRDRRPRQRDGRRRRCDGRSSQGEGGGRRGDGGLPQRQDSGRPRDGGSCLRDRSRGRREDCSCQRGGAFRRWEGASRRHVRIVRQRDGGSGRRVGLRGPTRGLQRPACRPLGPAPWENVPLAWRARALRWERGPWRGRAKTARGGEMRSRWGGGPTGFAERSVSCAKPAAVDDHVARGLRREGGLRACSMPSSPLSRCAGASWTRLRIGAILWSMSPRVAPFFSSSRR